MEQPPLRNPTPELFPTPPIAPSELSPGCIRQKAVVHKHLGTIEIGNRGKNIERQKTFFY